MFKQGQKFSVTSDDNVVFTYTIEDTTFSPSRGNILLVYSSGLDQRNWINVFTFSDFLKKVGAGEVQPPLKYKVWLINHLYYLQGEFEYLNEAIDYGKKRGFEFRVDLGEMACASWSPLGGLRYFTQYQQWAQNQQEILQQISG